MKLIKYFIQFIFIIFLFLLFKILGLRLSKSFSSFIFKIIGPHFRSKKISHSNLTIAFPELDEKEKEKISFLEINMKIKNESKFVQFLKTKINEIN